MQTRHTAKGPDVVEEVAPPSQVEKEKAELTAQIRKLREEEATIRAKRTELEAVYTEKCDDAKALNELEKLTPGQIKAMERLGGKVRERKEKEAREPKLVVNPETKTEDK